MAQAYRTYRTLTDVTGTTGTTSYYYQSMGEFSAATFQMGSSPTGSVTFTVEASAQPATAENEIEYQDVTSSLFGVSSVTGTNMFIIDQPMAFRAIRIKVVSAKTDPAENPTTSFKICTKVQN